MCATTGAAQPLLRAATSAELSPAQDAAQAPPVTDQLDGSPPPIAPASITRDADRRPTVRAIKLTEPFVHDGRLDERVYGDNEPFGDFIQVVPRNGELASERTDVWITYDDRNIYVSARVHDSAPPEQWVANELRRDTNQMRNNDHIGVAFDTFYDRRSGFMFYANPLGGFSDYSVVDEGAPNTDWNPVWTTRTGRFEGGWTLEMAIPFKSIRYTSGTNMVWGFQMRRSDPPQERMGLPEPGAAEPGRSDGAQPRVVVRHAGRTGPAAGVAQHGAQALRARPRDDRQPRGCRR